MTLTDLDQLREAAQQFRCTGSGRISKPWPYGTSGVCPCPPCQAQAVVLRIADELAWELRDDW